MKKVRDKVKTILRTHWHSGHYPVLLPHFRIMADGLQPVRGTLRPLPAHLLEALRLCDGTRTLADVADAAKVDRSALLAQHDEECLLLWRSAVPAGMQAQTGEPQQIIFSPHPDDAALSLGGLMLKAKPAATLVVNVISQTGWWRFGEAPTKEVQAIRAAEESLMARLTGARLRSLDLPEAVLRGHRYEEVTTAQPGEPDDEIAQAVAAAAANLARQYPTAHWRLPLAVGNHIDHRLTRDGALAGLLAAGVEKNRIGFYEDLPYAATLPQTPDFRDALPGRTLRSSSFKIQIRWKRELLRLYWSQINWSQIVEVGQYAARIGGGRAVERLWQLAGGQ